MAEQSEPVNRKVALKIIKQGMDTKQVVARFEAERQALAMMDHPNIARVLDAGATESGRPYFVMELVKGVPITEFCDKNKLRAPDRLKLFIQVCHAIQSAYQKAVIHRDVKPSNILVTLHHGTPLPKVIDFGIAKATNQKLTEKTLFTNYAQLIGTPAYMSPEQAEMSSLDVDTRTDVYSLGVLLYELLTGTTPFLEKELLSKGYGEMQRIIAEQEPERPSLRMSTLMGEQQTIITKNRAGDVPLLTRQLKGDLDWIIMKSLEKDRTRRYETANGLAEDIRRHLSDEPVLAARPSFRYQFAKLYYRHKPAFAAAAGIVLALLFGTVVSTAQAISANNARNDAYLAQIAAESAAASELELREQAQHQTRKALDLAEARRLDAYVGDMKTVDGLIKIDHFETAREILLKHLPNHGRQEADLRGFEWRYFWDASEPKYQHEATPGVFWERFAYGLALSPDKSKLVTRVGIRQLKVYDPHTLRLIRELDTEGAHRYRPVFSLDGSKLYLFVDGESVDLSRDVAQSSLHIYDTNDWSVEARIETWDVETGHFLGSLGRHPADIRDLVTLDNHMICLYRNGDLRKWDVSSAGKPKVPWTYVSPFTDDFVESRLIAADGMDVIEQLSPECLNILQTKRIEGRTPRRLNPFRVASVHTNLITSVRLLSPNGRFFLDLRKGSPDANRSTNETMRKARFYDLKNRGKVVVEWDVHPPSAGNIHWSPEILGIPTFISDHQLLCKSPSELELWDLIERTRTPIPIAHDFHPTHYAIRSIVADIHGDLLAIGHRKDAVSAEVILWSLSENRKIATFACGLVLLDLEFSKDGSRLAISDRGVAVQIIDVTNRTKLFELWGLKDDSRKSACFSPDGRTILTVDSAGAHLWNGVTGREMGLIERDEIGNMNLDMLRFTNDGWGIFGYEQDREIDDLKFLTPRSLTEIDAEIARSH